MAKAAGEKEIEKLFRKQLSPLKEQIRKWFYDPESGYFYDIRTKDSSFVKVAGPEAWITLWAGIASDRQARSVMEKIMDPKYFNTFIPFPTLSASHPDFNPEKGYWRGPVWIDQAYFALEGMKKYGYMDEYELLRNKLINNAEGIPDKGIPLYENYNPVDGKGLNATHFSWTAAHYLLLLNDEKE